MKLSNVLELCDSEKDFFNMTLRESYEKGFLPWFESFKKGEVRLKDNLSGMIENGLSEEEAFYILFYTGGGSSWINSELRNGEYTLSRCKKVVMEKLDFALSKVKSFDGEKTFRMDFPNNDEKDELDWFESKINSKIFIPYYLSTAKEDYENSEIVWEINTLPNTSSGKDISNLTNNKYELEVLFKRGTTFEIAGIDRSRNYIFLNEYNGSFDLVLAGRYLDE